MRSLCKNVIIDILKSEKMNLDSLEQLANLVLKDLKTFSSNDYIVSHLHVRLEMKNLMLNAAQVLPDHRSFFMSALLGEAAIPTAVPPRGYEEISVWL